MWAIRGSLTRKLYWSIAAASFHAMRGLSVM
jgi:hypothetical protein